jgi:uncharacterized protein YndB with AHSA1/START domain
MARFEDSIVSDAAAEEVWKLLYDPPRFPEWWAGMETVESGAPDEGGRRQFSYHPEGTPDVALPQILDIARDRSRVVISCLVTDLRVEWRLEPAAGGRGTLITVRVDIPDAEPQLLETQPDVIRRSMARLSELAARSSA